MTYQGARARPFETEVQRVFEVSVIRLDPQGWPSDVMWVEVSAKSNLDVGVPLWAPVADVVDALQDGAQVLTISLPPHTHLPQRHLEVFERDGEPDSITLAAHPGHPASSGGPPDLSTVATVEREAAVTIPPSYHAPRTVTVQPAFAVSRVALDADGRIVSVLWGPVDTVRNQWAGPEVVAPVADAVAVLRAGGHVFALFSSEHGHQPDRRFIVADYEDGRKTLVLAGPSTFERNIHDMDRLVHVHA